MIIREVDIKDAAQLLALMVQLDHETKFMMLEPGERQTTLAQQKQTIESFHGNQSRVMLVLSDDVDLYGFVVGVGQTANRNKHSMYCVIGLKQSAAGHGYGKQLLNTLETWARTHDFTRIELTVMCHNERAYRLYLSCGFEVEGVKRNSLCIDGEYVDEYYMSKLLS